MGPGRRHGTWRPVSSDSVHDGDRAPASGLRDCSGYTNTDLWKLAFYNLEGKSPKDDRQYSEEEAILPKRENKAGTTVENNSTSLKTSRVRLPEKTHPEDAQLQGNKRPCLMRSREGDSQTHLVREAEAAMLESFVAGGTVLEMWAPVYKMDIPPGWLVWQWSDSPSAAQDVDPVATSTINTASEEPRTGQHPRSSALLSTTPTGPTKGPR